MKSYGSRLDLVIVFLLTTMFFPSPALHADAVYSNFPTNAVLAPGITFVSETKVATTNNSLGAFSLAICFDTNVLRIQQITAAPGWILGSNLFADVASYRSGKTTIVGFRLGESTSVPEGELTFRTVWTNVSSAYSRTMVSNVVASHVDGYWRATEVWTPSASMTINGTVTTSSSTTTADPLAMALDGSGLVWATGGQTPWGQQTAVTHDGEDAIQSGAIANGGQTWVETTVTGPGVMEFWWKVSSATGDGVLRLLVDEMVARAGLSGDVDWAEVAYSVGPGPHTYRWEYVKGNAGSGGADAGYLDDVEWTPADGFRETGSWDQGAVLWTNGWSHLNWFGFYADMDLVPGGWIWHEYHDYLYMGQGSTATNIWFWVNPGGWVWTTSSAYPYLFLAGPSAWFWYLDGTDNPRFFLNTRTGRWYSL